MAQAVMWYHEVIIGQAQPQLLLSPGQVLGEAEHFARQTAVTLATRQVVAFNETDVDGLTDRRSGSACLHGCFRAEDNLGGHLDYASTFPALDDLGILQVCWSETLGCGLGPAFARDVQENFGYAI